MFKHKCVLRLNWLQRGARVQLVQRIDSCVLHLTMSSLSVFLSAIETHVALLNKPLPGRQFHIISKFPIDAIQLSFWHHRLGFLQHRDSTKTSGLEILHRPSRMMDLLPGGEKSSSQTKTRKGLSITLFSFSTLYSSTDSYIFMNRSRYSSSTAKLFSMG